MPIKISRIKHDGRKAEEVAWLGDDEWSLGPQLELLTKWLKKEADKLPSGNYSADIGFGWRRDAAGGGGGLGSEFLALMSKHRISLYFSEYPVFDKKQENDTEP
jgi:hypothetical protein